MMGLGKYSCLNFDSVHYYRVAWCLILYAVDLRFINNPRSLHSTFLTTMNFKSIHIKLRENEILYKHTNSNVNLAGGMVE
jgi:hypothetical protein